MKSLSLFALIFFRSVSSFAQLVLPGDFPDPSVARVGNTFWATATTSNWAPVFPLLRSDDLLHWENKSFVFETLPGWADYYFWAPEISFDNGKVWVYYSAHKKGGNLCLGVASAEKPEGPFTDHGPLMCQDAGSIDAFPVRDKNGKLYLIWKEDGNSVGKPTPIWIIEMKEDRSGFVGEKRELFRNDAGWEGNLVEGVSIIRHGDYFFAFYAGAGCCGRGCNYATGIARSKNLLGPWEKFSGNPVLTSNEEWICPGHGTPVEKDGKYYFLYHSYDKESNVYTGRQGLIKEFVFTEDQWIRLIDDPVDQDAVVAKEIKDDFIGARLSLLWQWSVFDEPSYTLNNGMLELKPGKKGFALLGQKTYSGDYRVRVSVNVGKSTSIPGIAVIGDDDNYVALLIKKNKLVIEKKQTGKTIVLSETEIGASRELTLELKVSAGKALTFLYSNDDKSSRTLNETPIDDTFLPPWDRAVRVGLITKGQNDQKAVFENFILYH